MKKKKKKESKKKVNQRWGIVLLLCISFICFSSSLNNGFVNWDDDQNFYDNPQVRDIDGKNFWDNTKAIFSSTVIGNYNPLSIWTFAIEKRVWGLYDTVLGKPSSFYWHLDNLLLHLLTVLFVYLLALKMRIPLAASLFIAALFAIHPMRVESVAWLTERKDVLFGSLYFIGLYFYADLRENPHKKRNLIWLSLCFILSLFAKIQAVIFPISLILLDYWFDEKLFIKKIIYKIPLLLISLAVGLLGLSFLDEQGSLASTTDIQGIQRVFIGSWSYLIYLVKSIVPFRLSPLYPYPPSLPTYFYPSILVFIAAGFTLIWSYLRGQRVLFFGLAFFSANIFFLLQIVAAGQGFLADRFTYVAYFGLFVLFAHYLFQWPVLTKWHSYLFIIPFLVYGPITFQQNKIWKDSGTLWTHVITYYKKATLPYGNRANFYRDEGNTAAALADYSASIRLKSSNPEVYNSRGRLYFNFNNKDSLQKALVDYTKAISFDNTKAEFYANRGATYSKLNQAQKAIDDLDVAIQIDPDFANAYLNRSVVYNSMGKFQKAVDDIDQFLRYKPNSPDIIYEGGNAYFKMNKYAAAIPYFNKAIELNPKNGLFFYQRSRSYFSVGNITEAKTDLTQAKNLGVEVPTEVWNLIMSR